MDEKYNIEVELEQKQAEEKVRVDKEMAKRLRLAELQANWEAQNADEKVTAEQQRAWETQVDAEMADNPTAPAASEGAEEGPEVALKQGLSKITDALANTPFSFIGKILEFLGKMVGFIMPVFKSIMPALGKIGEMFNPNKASAHAETDEALNPEESSPNKTPIDSVKELMQGGKFREALTFLHNQEQTLCAQMEGVLQELRNKPAEETLEQYRKLLGELSEEYNTFNGQATTEYMKDNLKTRIEYFNRYSSEAQAILRLHSEKEAVDIKIRETPSNSRLQGIDTTLQALQQKKRDLESREEAHLNKLPAVITSFRTISEAHKTIFEQEKEKREPIAP
jgi:hypothetical protein